MPIDYVDPGDEALLVQEIQYYYFGVGGYRGVQY